MNIRAIAYVEFLPRANEVWGKVIFSQASVILSRGSLHPWRGVYIQWGGCLHPGGWADPPPPSTTGYGQQAGGTRPTGMHTCQLYFLWRIYIAGNGLGFGLGFGFQSQWLHCTMHYITLTQNQIPNRYCNHFWDGYPYPDQDPSPCPSI